MGNGVLATVQGIGQVCLKMTLGKTLILKDVPYVPSINWNLISMSLLLRQHLKLVFESNKLILSKFGVFVGKLYDLGGLFHLSSLSTHSSYYVNVVSNNDMVNDIWHSHLCHVNFEAIKRLSDMSLIPENMLKVQSVVLVCKQSNLKTISYG
jgi:hypothetical protein